MPSRATFLYKLSRLSYRRRRLVALLWVALLATVRIRATSADTPESATRAERV